MDPNNILTSEQVQSFYHEDSEIYKCSFCGAAETKENKHKQCGKCQKAKYCSRECQIKHWKGGHKNECWVPTAHPTVIENLQVKGSPQERVERFKDQYRPLLQILTMYALQTGFKDEDQLYETHVAWVALETDPSPRAKQPMLRIKNVRAEHIKNLPDFMHKMFVDAKAEAPGDCDFTAIALIEFDNPGGNPAGSLIPFAYYDSQTPMGDLLKMCNLSLSFQRDRLKNEVEKYVNTINEMASGGAKDLKAATKRKVSA